MSLCHPLPLRFLFYSCKVKVELHERRGGCVRAFDLHQKWEDEGGFLSFVNHFYDVNIAMIPLLCVVSHGSKLFHFCYFCGYFQVIFDSFDLWCFGEFWSTNLVARMSLIMCLHS